MKWGRVPLSFSAAAPARPQIQFLGEKSQNSPQTRRVFTARAITQFTAGVQEFTMTSRAQDKIRKNTDYTNLKSMISTKYL